MFDRVGLRTTEVECGDGNVSTGALAVSGLLISVTGVPMRPELLGSTMWLPLMGPVSVLVRLEQLCPPRHVMSVSSLPSRADIIATAIALLTVVVAAGKQLVSL